MLNIKNDEDVMYVTSAAKKIMLFFDMDGTLNHFDTNATLEEVKSKGYMLNRIAIEKMVNLALVLKLQGFDVNILSAVYQNGYSEEEKNRWLDNHSLQGINRFFVPCGTDKGLVIKSLQRENPDKTLVLIDDYSPNLFSWEKAGGVGIKFYNGINGTNGTWANLGKFSLYKNESIQEMNKKIMWIANVYS
ncbi:MAG: hypothetical protein K6B67_05405 [Lachnospiraceae bacterium]|nr:hypothetical protein [Lachnospiraceae bacterium]